MKNLMNIMMLSCKKATELIEKKNVTRLSCVEQIQLKVHKGVCSACRAYEKQSLIIDQSIKKLAEQDINEKVKLSEDKKLKIIQSLQKH